MTTSINNPILPGFHPDPSICRVGDDYYLVNSSFEYFPGVPIFHSRDLAHWRPIGYCLTRPSQLPLENCPSSQGIYAPTLRHHNELFYMVTTNVSGGGNFYVTASDPAGPWSEPVWLQAGGIDPSLLFDDDGQVYFTCQGNEGILQGRLDLGNGRLLEPLRPIWQGTGGAYPEGPHLYHIRGWYYLMIAEGGTEYGHMQTIARSKNPWGPFESCPRNPILSHRSRGDLPIQSLGHADLVQDQAGNWWLVCLGVRPNGYPFCHHLGRETFLAPLHWDEQDWPLVGEQGQVTMAITQPALTPHPWPPEAERDDFDQPELRLAWNFLRSPAALTWSLSERPGWLCLHGTAANLDENGLQAWVGRRQERFDCQVRAALEFAPQSPGEEAGLCVRMNERHHYEIALLRSESGSQIIVRQRIGSLQAITAREDFYGSAVELLIRAEKDRYTFGYASNGTEPRWLASGETRYLSTEVAGGFTGVFFGMYASGNGKQASAPACFDWFELKAAE